MHDAVEVIIAKRDGGELSDSQIDWVIDAYTARRRRRRADVGAGDGDPAQRHGPPRDRALDGRDDRLGRADGLRLAVAADRRQALHRRRRRQDHAAAGPAGRRLRRRRAAALRARPRATPAARSTSSSRSPAGGPRCPTTEMFAQLEYVGAVICAAGDGAGAGRQEALRAARRHRHRRGDPADRLLDHVQEDRGGHRRARARRQGRHRRLHEGPSRRPGSWPRPWSALGTDAGVHTVALLTDMSTPLGLTAGNALEVAESVEVLAGRRAAPTSSS